MSPTTLPDGFCDTENDTTCTVGFDKSTRLLGFSYSAYQIDLQPIA